MSFIKIQRIDPHSISNPDPGHIYVGQDMSTSGFSGFWQRDEWGNIFYIDCLSGGTGGVGTSGTSGVNGSFFGTHGSSGTSGFGTSGTSGKTGISGTSGTSSSSGISGSSGSSGKTGTAGTTGSSGFTGTSGTSGVDGNFYGSSGTSGYSGGYGGATRVWQFSNSLPPAMGKFWGGNDSFPGDYSFSLINKIYINTTDLDSQPEDNWLNTWVTGTLKIEDKNNASIFGIYTLLNTSNTKPFVTQNLISGFTCLTSSNGNLVNGNNYFISFVISGQGTNGSSGKDGTFYGSSGTSGSGSPGSSGTSGSGSSGTSGTSSFGSSGTSGDSGSSGSSGVNGLLPGIGNDYELLFRDTGTTYGYNTTPNLNWNKTENRLEINGDLHAVTKSFSIQHPTQEGKRLVYGSLESPYHGIRLTGKGKTTGKITRVDLPEYVFKLVNMEDVNIQITAYKTNKKMWVENINIDENYFNVQIETSIFDSGKNNEFFWTFTSVRKDVNPLKVII